MESPKPKCTDADYEYYVWKWIEVGTHTCTMDIVQDILDRGMMVRRSAIYGADQVAISPRKISIPLVYRSVERLGFKHETHLEQIYAAAKKQKLYQVPQEVAFQLRLQFPDQPELQRLHIASPPILDRNGLERIFRVNNVREKNENGLVLRTCYGYPKRVFERRAKFVFTTQPI